MLFGCVVQLTAPSMAVQVTHNTLALRLLHCYVTLCHTFSFETSNSKGQSCLDFDVYPASFSREYPP